MGLDQQARVQWPTPLQADGGKHSPAVRMAGGNHTLTSATLQGWPTPRAEDGECAGGHRGKDDTLHGAIVRPKEGKVWATPTAGDGASSGSRCLPGSNAHPGVSLTDQTQRTLWPTPAAGNPNDGEDPETWNARHDLHASKDEDATRSGLPLGIAVKWPTPMSADYRSGLEGDETLDSNSRPLRAAVANPSLWPTPMGVPDSEASHGQVSGDYRRRMEAAGAGSGQLNPAWVCLLMGWPIAPLEGGGFWSWTSLDPAPPGASWPGWPAGMGPFQFPYEPPRTVPKGTIKGRANQLKASGNGVVPHQAELAFSILLGPAQPFLRFQ